MTQAVSTVFPSVAPSAGSARRFVGAALRRWECPESVIEMALLLTSELVTNVYRHVSSEARLSVQLRDGVLRVEVVDAGAGGVELRPLDPERADGRGLQIVDSLADRWGSESGPRGHVAWFELAGSGAGALGNLGP